MIDNSNNVSDNNLINCNNEKNNNFDLIKKNKENHNVEIEVGAQNNTTLCENKEKINTSINTSFIEKSKELKVNVNNLIITDKDVGEISDEISSIKNEIQKPLKSKNEKMLFGKLLIGLRKGGFDIEYSILSECRVVKIIDNKLIIEIDGHSRFDKINNAQFKEKCFELINENIAVDFIDSTIDKKDVFDVKSFLKTNFAEFLNIV